MQDKGIIRTDDLLTKHRHDHVSQLNLGFHQTNVHPLVKLTGPHLFYRGPGQVPDCRTAADRTEGALDGTCMVSGDVYQVCLDSYMELSRQLARSEIIEEIWEEIEVFSGWDKRNSKVP